MEAITLDDWKTTYGVWIRHARLLSDVRGDVRRFAQQPDSPEYRASLLSASVMEREELAAWVRTRMTLGAYLDNIPPGPNTLSREGDVRFSVVAVAQADGLHVWQVIAFLRNRAMVVVESGVPQATRDLALAAGRKAFPPREWR